MATERPPAPPPLNAQEQDVVLRERVANQERGLKMLLRRIGAVAASKGSQAAAREMASFACELDAFVLGLARMESVAQHTCSTEVQAYNEQVTSIQQERDETTQAIDDLKRELIEVQQDRQNKLEYDALAGEILKVGTRADLESQLASLRENIETLTNESRKYSEVMDSSQGRFENIASQLEALRAEVGFEVGERERRAVEREGADGEADVGEASDSGEQVDEGKRSRTRGEEHGGEDDADYDGGEGRPAASRRASSRRGATLDPTADPFLPHGGHGIGGAEEGSRASTPGLIGTKRTRASQRGIAGERDDAAGRSHKRTTRSSKDAMPAVGEDDEEEEGAA